MKKSTLSVIILLVCVFFLSSCTMTGQPIRNTYDTVGTNPGSNADSSDLDRLSDLDEEDIRTTVTCHVGDLDCDGLIDFSDINHFVNAMIDQPEFLEDCENRETDCWKPEFGGCENAMLNADVSENGAIGFEDINIFVDLLLGVNPECSDGIDNDCDLYEDYPGDLGCYSAGDVSEETTCGNNHVEDGEACDGIDLDGKGCQTLGFPGGGVLQCNPLCLNFDTSNCLECTNNNHCPPDEVCQNNVCVFPQTGDTICGDGTAEGWEECDGTDGLISCNAFNPAYTGGQLGCFGVDDTYGRGCSYDFSNCECNELVVDFRIFPLDGSSGDVDGIEDGVITTYGGRRFTFDLSPACNPLTYQYRGENVSIVGEDATIFLQFLTPSYPHTVWKWDWDSDELDYKTAYDVKLEYTIDFVNTVTVVNDKAIRKLLPIEVEDTSPHLNLYLPQYHAVVGGKVFAIGGPKEVTSVMCYHDSIAWAPLSDPYPMKPLVRTDYATYYDDYSGGCGASNYKQLFLNDDRLFVFRTTQVDFSTFERYIEVYSTDPHDFTQLALLDLNDLTGSDIYKVALSGNALYGLELKLSDPMTLHIVDVSDLQNPVYSGSMDVGTKRQEHNSLFASDNVLMIQTYPSSGDDKLDLYDISNKLNPVYASSIDGLIGEMDGNGNVFFEDVIIAKKEGQGGITFFDVSNVYSIQELGHVDMNTGYQNYRPFAFNNDLFAWAIGGSGPSDNYVSEIHLASKKENGDGWDLLTPLISPQCNNFELYNSFQHGSENAHHSIFIAESEGKTWLYVGSEVLGGYKRFELMPTYEE